MAAGLGERRILGGNLSRPGRVRQFLRISIGTEAQCETLVQALHGIVQVYFHWGYLTSEWPRATSIICIPNSFATLLNLGLLPLIALYLLRKPSRAMLVLVVLLFAALLLSQSKGGLAGLGAGLIFMGFGMRRAGMFEKPLPWRSLLLTLIAVAVLIQMGNHFVGVPGVAERIANWRVTESGGRLYIYQIAWRLIEAHPWSGIGYYNFQYFFLRDKYPHFIHELAYFAHDDYLQIWLETGIVGLLLLLTLIGSFYRTVGKSLRKPAVQDRTTLIAIGAACTSVFAHALVDYPLYTHVVLLMLGAYIGAASRIVGDNDAAVAVGSDKRLIRFLVTLVVLWLPAQKVVAEFYADQGLREMKQNHLQAAVDDYTLSRRFTPHESYGYFAEGSVWYDAAIATHNRVAAVDADGGQQEHRDHAGPVSPAHAVEQQSAGRRAHDGRQGCACSLRHRR